MPGDARALPRDLEEVVDDGGRHDRVALVLGVARDEAADPVRVRLHLARRALLEERQVPAKVGGGDVEK